MVLPCQKDARGENTEINYGLDTAGEKEKRTPNKNVDRSSTSSHDNKKFRIRAMEKQRGMAFGLRKTATAVKKTGQIDRYTGVLKLKKNSGTKRLIPNMETSRYSETSEPIYKTTLYGVPEDCNFKPRSYSLS